MVCYKMVLKFDGNRNPPLISNVTMFQDTFDSCPGCDDGTTLGPHLDFDGSYHPGCSYWPEQKTNY